MALSADLFGIDEEGGIIWHWPAKTWHGQRAAEAIGLRAVTGLQSWHGDVTPERVAQLRTLFGGREVELAGTAPSADLDELMQRARTSLLMIVEEWGST